MALLQNALGDFEDYLRSLVEFDKRIPKDPPGFSEDSPGFPVDLLAHCCDRDSSGFFMELLRIPKILPKGCQ